MESLKSCNTAYKDIITEIQYNVHNKYAYELSDSDVISKLLKIAR